MIIRQGIISNIIDNTSSQASQTLLIRLNLPESCSSCEKSNCCQASFFGKREKNTAIPVANSSQRIYCVGDEVTIGIPERSLLTSSLWIYGLPLLFIFFSLLLVFYFLPNAHDGHYIAAFLTSSVISWYLIRNWSRRAQSIDLYKPQLIID